MSFDGYGENDFHSQLAISLSEACAWIGTVGFFAQSVLYIQSAVSGI